MPTLIYLDGFEHWTVSTNDFNATDGLGVFDTLAGTPTNVAGRNGGRALQVSPAGALILATKNIPGTDPTITVVSFYLKFTVLPTVNTDVFTLDAAAGENGRLWFNNGTGKLNITFSQVSPDSAGDAGPVIVTGTWYRIDMRCDVSGGTRTLDLQVDGSAATQDTQVVAASTILAWRFGADVGTPTYTAQYDDFVASNTNADYPLGPHKVLPLHVNGDGTHEAGITAGDFDRADGTDILTSTTNSWLDLDDWITGADDGASGDILCLVGSGTEYVEHTFSDTSEATIWGVTAIVASPVSSTTAHTATFRIVNAAGTTVVDLFSGDVSISVATHYAQKLLAANPTSTTVNGYKHRFGFSTDPAPDPAITAVMLQIAVPEAAPDNRAEVSWAELEVPSLNNRAEVSWAELEVPTPDNRAEVSWAELEVPLAQNRAEVSWAELEVPSLGNRAEVSWAEFEVPIAAVDNRAEVSWAEFEVPIPDNRAEVSWAELEVPTPDNRAEVSWAEFEIPFPDNRAEVSWAEFEVPSLDNRAEVSWAEFEVPNVGGEEGVIIAFIAFMRKTRRRMLDTSG